MSSEQHGPNAKPPHSHGVMGAMRRVAGPVLILLVIAFFVWYLVYRAHSLPPAP